MTILRRAAPTRWLYPAILLLLFMEKSSAVEIAGYGGSASWTQIGATFESDGSDSPGSSCLFPRMARACSSARVTVPSPCTNGNPVRAPGHRSVISLDYPIRQRVSFRRWQRGCARRRRFTPGQESVWTARVFHYSGGSWQQVGSNIVGPSSERLYC